MLLCKEQQCATNMNDSSSLSKIDMLVKYKEIYTFTRFLRIDCKVLGNKLLLEFCS